MQCPESPPPGARADDPERSVIEDAVRRRPELLHELVEQLPCVLWATDRDLRWTDSLGGGLEALGHRPRDSVGASMSDYVRLDDPAVASHRRALAGEGATYETAYRGHDLRCHVLPLRDDGGDVAGCVGLAVDVTERRRAEEALRQSEHLHSTLVNSLGGIVWEADAATFRFTFVSPQAERILGYPAEQWLSEPDFWRAHTHPDDVGWCSTLCRDATARGCDHSFEYRMLAADGRVVWLHDVVTVKAEPGGQVRLRGIMLDVTERRRLEEQFRQAQKMEAVGQLAGGLAHDFNNLLMVIYGCGEMLQGHLPEDGPARGLLREMLAAGQLAAGLTRQLLLFSQKKVATPRLVDLNLAVTRFSSMLRRLIGEDVEVVTRLQPELWAVKADPGHLDQVLMNLAVNARDAMPQGGRLTIQTRNVGLVPPRAGEHVLVEVSDTGHGMTEEVRARIWEPFFTTKGPGKGTGLGLATVYGVVQQAGGYVSVRSEPGRGSTFEVYLPRGEGRPAPEPEGADGERSVRGDETVLVAEDEQRVRALTRRALERSGYTVLESADGEEAVRVAAAHPGEIHLLVTDVVMPGMRGGELARRLTAARPRMKVLYISGHADDAAILCGLREEEVSYLEKPFAPRALAAKVREVLDRP
jgi:PAS domain S-box-containing protein